MKDWFAAGNAYGRKCQWWWSFFCNKKLSFLHEQRKYLLLEPTRNSLDFLFCIFLVFWCVPKPEHFIWKYVRNKNSLSSKLKTLYLKSWHLLFKLFCCDGNLIQFFLWRCFGFWAVKLDIQLQTSMSHKIILSTFHQCMLISKQTEREVIAGVNHKYKNFDENKTRRHRIKTSSWFHWWKSERVFVSVFFFFLHFVGSLLKEGETIHNFARNRINYNVMSDNGTPE